MEEELELFDYMATFELTKEYALQLDQEDRIASFRNRFLFPQKQGNPKTYFLGNSLGLQPVSARLAMAKVLQQWADNGVESFFHGNDPWLNFHGLLVKKLSEIAGAKSTELSIMNQLSVNIHLMLVSFYKPVGKRKKILIESKAFPSDQYAVDSFIKLLGQDPQDILIEVKPIGENQVVQDKDVVAAIQQHADEIALVFIGGINYYTGHVFDMKFISDEAHKIGAFVGFDLAHAIGNIELNLHDWGVDFACWCSYKYLNAGPGAVGAVFVHERHHLDTSLKRLTGWWGYKKEDRFLMEDTFVLEPDATGWQLSTPSIFLYACLKASLSIFEEAGWKNILVKQNKMKGWLKFLIDDITSLEESHVKCLTPDSRGCQVSLFFQENGKVVYDQLTEAGFMVDWREPGVIRLAPVPLYNTFEEVWSFYETLKSILTSSTIKP